MDISVKEGDPFPEFVGETQTGVLYPVNLVWLAVLGLSASSQAGPSRWDTAWEGPGSRWPAARASTAS